VYCSLIQPDGKIMIAGSFTSFNGIDAGRIIRLNSDGLRDATFNAGSGFTSSIVYATPASRW
jgi:hypothetical protein